MHEIDDIQAVIAAQQSRALQSRQRRLVVLAGERLWSQAQVEQYLSNQRFNQSLCISAYEFAGIDCLPYQQTRQKLGQQLDCLIYDAWSGLNPDALAAVAGCLAGGGLLIMLVPPLNQWPGYDDPDYRRLLVHPFKTDAIAGRFVEHIVKSLQAARHSVIIEQGKEIYFPAEPNVKVRLQELPADSDCLTADQAQAVEAIGQVQHGHRRRPLVITADRGRGKSAALGIASARLMQQRDCRIVITAPRPASVAVAFEHAAGLLSVPTQNATRLQWQQSSLQFIAPDELLRQSGEIELLLVDEAAAIPASMLELMLKKYPRIVFVTTVHGYEGTGRGFDVKFKQTLQKITPQWRALQLTQPVRWAADDPVEQWLFDALLLNARSVNDVVLQTLRADQCVTEKLCRDELLADCQTLQELFSLLVLAHYQTTPADLRILLDGVNISVWISRFRGHVVAAALVAEEGCFDDDLCSRVWKGERRPQGHLLPQSLAAHGGFLNAPALKYLRVVRVAVHPAVHRKSLGKQIIKSIVEQSRLDHFDFVGSSFAATEDVVAFWRHSHFVPVLLGVSRDASSGCHSLLVLSALSTAGSEVLAEARRRFNQQFPRELMILHQQLDAELASVLMLNTDQENDYSLDQQQWLDTEAYAEHYRQYDQCLLPLWKLVCQCLSQAELNGRLSHRQKALLIRRVLQNQSQQSVVTALGMTGKKQLQTEMREAIAGVRQLLIQN